MIMNTLPKIQVDTIAEAAVVELLSNIFGDVAYLDTETVRNNIELGCEGGMSKADRSIRSDLADYIIDNFSLLFVGMIVNTEFRSMIFESVSIEIALDDKDEETVRLIRSEMNSDSELTSGNEYLINLDTYDDGLYRDLNRRLSDSFDIITPYSKAIDELINDMSEEDMIDIGFCVSNFMYFVRAFSKNALFVMYTKSVIDSVKRIFIKTDVA